MLRAVFVGILIAAFAVVMTRDLPADPVCTPLNALTLREPARPERPEPLVSVPTANSQALLARIKEKLSHSGFTVTKANDQTGEVLASHGTSKGRDRVFIWLERSYNSPATYLCIHADFEHIEAVLGAESGSAVMPLSERDFERRFGPLQNRLLSLAQEGKQ